MVRDKRRTSVSAPLALAGEHPHVRQVTERGIVIADPLGGPLEEHANAEPEGQYPAGIDNHAADARHCVVWNPGRRESAHVVQGHGGMPPVRRVTTDVDATRTAEFPSAASSVPAARHLIRDDLRGCAIAGH